MFKLNNRKIDFIVGGVQKAGTTALYSYLKEHPQIGMSNIKEIHFFDDDVNFNTKKNKYNLYHNHFDFTNKKKVLGEITPIYFYWKTSMERIFEYNKSIKLIFILRNPIERAFSHWNMEVSRNNEKRDFFTCINDDLVNQKQNRITSYVKRGFYSIQIERVLKFFNDTQVLFIKYEDFVKEQKANLDMIFKFLNVDSTLFDFEFKNVHQLKNKEQMKFNSRKLLLDIYKHDIEKVETMLNWDCNDWKL